MSLISVIIPIYNVEKYLRQCLDTVINQSYKNLEIILVDDGSPDGCANICEEYALKDSRIKVIHKSNEGLGYARNTGLKHASGDYIYFLDSDDWIDLNFFECMAGAMESYNADMVICGFNKASGNKIEAHRMVSETEIIENEMIADSILLPMIGRESTYLNDYTINMCVWTNLYKRSIIDKNKLLFFSEREYLSEDICFNLKYLHHINKVIMIPDCLYYYRNNPVSLTNQYKPNEYFMIVRLYNEIFQLIKSIGLENKIEYRLHRFFITKTRQTIALAVNTKMPFKSKYQIVRTILKDETLQRILKEYPIRRYALKYKIPAILIKHKMVLSTILLFRLRGSVRRLLGQKV